MTRSVLSLFGVVFATVAVAVAQSADQSKADAPKTEQLIGTWRGTSTCTDRVAAPACQDETIVYDFKSGPEPGTVHWVADKVVNGKRVPMGELDLTYDKVETCWKVGFASPQTRVVWRLSVVAGRLTGTARLQPGNETVRKVDARKQ